MREAVPPGNVGYGRLITGRWNENILNEDLFRVIEYGFM